MAKILVFHYTEKGRLPKLTKEQLNDISNRIYDELKNYPDVKFNGTFIDEEGRGICDWEAPDTKVVEEIIVNVLGAPPVDGMSVVKRIL